jgi:hypothetical protein
MDPIQFQNVHSGDTMLFKCNGIGANVIQIFNSSEWNHAALAIRMNSKHEVVLEGEELYVFEMTAQPSKDTLTGKKFRGCIIKPISELIKNYNRIEVRHVNKRYLVPSLLPRIKKFIDIHHQYPFPDGFIPFLGVWLGLPFAGVRDKESRGMFCSEMVTHFYDDCFGPTIAEVDDISYSPGELTTIFGDSALDEHFLFSPEIYDKRNLRDSRIFGQDNLQSTIHISYDSAFQVFVVPISLMIIIIILIYLLLPKNKE